MLAYRDFVPAGFKPTNFESFDDALAAANTWIDAESVKVVTVETVVLPSIAGLQLVTARFDHRAYLLGGTRNQFVRVWYEK